MKLHRSNNPFLLNRQIEPMLDGLGNRCPLPEEGKFLPGWIKKIGFNSCQPDFFQKKPFGENVEGLFRCGNVTARQICLFALR
jgi:hypothetical protein